jgi:hypothetical protein
MLIDQALIDRFNDQIDALKKQKASIDDAIGRANDNLKLLKANPGKNVQDVIPPEPHSPAAKGGHK